MPSEEELGQQLQRCLTDATLPVDVRAAGAIVTLFGLPLSKIVQLAAEHLTERGDDMYLTMDKQPVLMPPRLAAILHSAARASSRSALGRSLPGTRWLFPGFSPGRFLLGLNVAPRSSARQFLFRLLCRLLPIKQIPHTRKRRSVRNDK